MKSSDCASLLMRSACLLEAGKATEIALILRGLASLFSLRPTKKALEVIRAIDGGDLPDTSDRQAQIALAIPAIVAIVDLLGPIAAKGVISDLQHLTTLLEKYRSVDARLFLGQGRSILAQEDVSNKKKAKPLKTLRADLVEAYNKRLEEALGDEDGFREVYAKLNSDTELSAAELAALAKRFAFASTKARDQSLRKILARHQALIIARAASRATAGRIAG